MAVTLYIEGNYSILELKIYSNSLFKRAQHQVNRFLPSCAFEKTQNITIFLCQKVEKIAGKWTIFKSDVLSLVCEYTREYMWVYSHIHGLYTKEYNLHCICMLTTAINTIFKGLKNQKPDDFAGVISNLASHESCRFRDLYEMRIFVLSKFSLYFQDIFYHNDVSSTHVQMFL